MVDGKLDNTPLRPVVGNGSSSPVEDNGPVPEGQEVLTRMANLQSTSVLEQCHGEEIYKEREGGGMSKESITERGTYYSGDLVENVNRT